MALNGMDLAVEFEKRRGQPLSEAAYLAEYMTGRTCLPDAPQRRGMDIEEDEPGGVNIDVSSEAAEQAVLPRVRGLLGLPVVGDGGPIDHTPYAEENWRKLAASAAYRRKLFVS